MQSNLKVGRHAVKPKGRQTCSQTERQAEYSLTDGETSRLIFSKQAINRQADSPTYRKYDSRVRHAGQ